jgi:uncharacterized membrane protein YbaN (DUF454 family)
MVRDHRDGLGMPRRAKAMAITMMVAAVALSATFAVEGVARLVLVVLGMIGTWYVGWRVPTREVVLARRGLAPH